MSWSFRALVLTAGVLWGLAPQIACFMPDQSLTQREMDCCEKMAGDCGQMDMSCCQTVVRTNVVGVTAKAVRNLVPHVDMAPKPVRISVAMPLSVRVDLSIRNDHAPPHDVGVYPLILRI